MTTATLGDEAFECPWCHDTIRAEGSGDTIRIIAVASGEIHECWRTEVDPENLLIISEETP